MKLLSMLLSLVIALNTLSSTPNINSNVTSNREIDIVSTNEAEDKTSPIYVYIKKISVFKCTVCNNETSENTENYPTCLTSGKMTWNRYKDMQLLIKMQLL